MKITRCATAVVEANYDYTYVRIFADNDLYGTGECFFAPSVTMVAVREQQPRRAEGREQGDEHENPSDEAKVRDKYRSRPAHARAV